MFNTTPIVITAHGLNNGTLRAMPNTLAGHSATGKIVTLALPNQNDQSSKSVDNSGDFLSRMALASKRVQSIRKVTEGE